MGPSGCQRDPESRGDQFDSHGPSQYCDIRGALILEYPCARDIGTNLHKPRVFSGLGGQYHAARVFQITRLTHHDT